ncbi:response regulator [Streptosporangium sp. NPDC000396]|uniref:response regulator n=1 Tax=Streptosporangium sp. NPDC000396 TaxID=3366185 RepID=UPI0036850BEF
MHPMEAIFERALEPYARSVREAAPIMDRDSPARRLVIVDDDDINRHGLAAILSIAPGLQVVAGLDHERAMAWQGWPRIDVALVDAADERRADDHFPGVAVVETIRTTSPDTVVIVITGHFFDGAIRRRMKEARADYFYHRGELADAAVLVATVRDPRRAVPPPADPEEEIRHGVSRHSRVNRAVRHALERNLPETIAERRNPRSRVWERLRREFNREAELTAMTSDGRTPDRRQDLPSLPQISRLLQWATRVKTSPHQADDG